MGQISGAAAPLQNECFYCSQLRRRPRRLADIMVTYIDSSENSDGVRDGLTREYDTDYKAPTSDSEENDSDEVYWRKRVRR
jgi:hypothetical protein